jgi:hypothetical protein
MPTRFFASIARPGCDFWWKRQEKVNPLRRLNAQSFPLFGWRAPSDSISDAKKYDNGQNFTHRALTEGLTTES